MRGFNIRVARTLGGTAGCALCGVEAGAAVAALLVEVRRELPGRAVLAEAARAADAIGTVFDGVC